MALTRFIWKYSTDGPLALYGSFNNWSIGYVMNHDIETNTMICDLNLEPGTYTYKFKLGNKWLYDILKPTATDSNGNVNNLITIQNNKSLLDAMNEALMALM